MKRRNSIIGLIALMLTLACSTEKSDSIDEQGNDFRSSDATAHWGSDMMDNQATTYQNLYLQLTKRELKNQSGEASSELRIWLEGSTQTSEAIASNIQANYCLLEQCNYASLSIESCTAQTRSSGPGVECLVYLPLTLEELALTGSAMELKVNYCDEVCTETKLQYSSGDKETVVEDNRYSGPEFTK